MNCNKFMQLVPQEKTAYIGMLLHAVQNDDDMFEVGQLIIELAKSRGIFKKVKINENNSEDPIRMGV